MINYVIINGVNSNTKNGLMINELPPISKPQMRTDIEEIDGRDGDIITKLGYSAYDKTITIGLWGTSYDVNDIIAFFNKEGIITFSNEPDKYYKFTMLDDFDIETLLRFKTASITFHCQPYKYPTEETPIELEYEFIEQDNAESATLNNTNGDSHLDITLKGNTSQYTTTGKNLFELPNTETKSGVTLTKNSDGTFNISGVATANVSFEKMIESPLASGTYTLSKNTNENLLKIYVQDRNNSMWLSNLFALESGSTITKAITPTGNQTYFLIQVSNGTTINLQNVKIQLESGSEKTTWEKYTGGIPAPNPSYPQQIHEVSGDNKVNVCGKNIWDESILNQYKDSEDNECYIFNNNTLYNQNLTPNIVFETNTQYTIQYIGKQVSGNPRLAIKYTDGTTQNVETQIIATTLTKYTQISTINKTIDYIMGDFGNNASNTFYIKKNSVMIEKGSSASSYEPYNGDTYEIDLRTSKNLFNKYGETLVDKTFGTNGAIIDSTSDSVLLDYIAVKPNTTYTLSGTNWARLHEYNESKVSIAHINPINANSVTITTTSQTRYVRIGYVTTKKDTVQFEKGSSATSYVPYNSLKMRGIGTYEDYFTKNSGKNLAIKNIKGYIDRNNNVVKIDNASESFVFYAKKGETYCCSSLTSYNTGWIGKVETDNVVNDTPITDIKDVRYQGGGVKTFTSDFTGYCVVYVNTTLNNAIKDTFMLNEGSTPLPYEPYGTGQWCKYNAIGSITFDGTENWGLWTTQDTSSYSHYLVDNLIDYNNSLGIDIRGVCNRFIVRNGGISTDISLGLRQVGDSLRRIYVTTLASLSTLELFKTYLSTHNVTLYYVLANPYLSLIENETLISQLDKIEKALSKDGQTNVSQVNNDKAFIMDLIAIKDGTDEVEVNNIGNTYSKPTIALEGTGDINIYLNGTQMLKATLTDKMTIDTTNLEAYNPDTMTLLNRQLVGDISKFTLSSGNNTIKVDGNLTKATITDYVRYL